MKICVVVLQYFGQSMIYAIQSLTTVCQSLWNIFVYENSRITVYPSAAQISSTLANSHQVWPNLLCTQEWPTDKPATMFRALKTYFSSEKNNKKTGMVRSVHIVLQLFS